MGECAPEPRPVQPVMPRYDAASDAASDATYFKIYNGWAQLDIIETT